MKFSILLVLSILVIVKAEDISPDEENEIFNDYLTRFKIRLGRSDNLDNVRNTFIEEYKNVERHNREYAAGNVTYELGINEYSYLTYEEKIKYLTGLLPSEDEEQDTEEGNSTISQLSNQRTRSGRGAAPAAFAWTTVPGVVRPVQNQGSCASCWAFGAIGALEGQMAIKKNIYDKLSEQEVIECARNPYTYALYGCNGGYHYLTYDHSKNYGGITVAANRPYKGSTNSACVTSTPRAPGSRSVSWLAVANDEESMKQAVYNIGPLYVTIYVSNDMSSFTGTGVYTDARGYCYSTAANNHAVLLVGYGTQNGIDYWLLKNSWGSSWGDQGYFRLQRGRKLCGITKTINYPVLA